MFENFTRRHRLDYVEIDLRYEYVPSHFRYDLLKLIYAKIPDDGEGLHTLREYALYRGAAVSVNTDYQRLFGVDEIQEFYSPDLLVDLLLSAKWHEVLSIVEFLINEGPLAAKAVNDLFAYHGVGYEVEGHGRSFKVVVKYATLIEDTKIVLSADIPYEPVVAAITAARDALIEPTKIDVAASISHSVAAVEAYLRGLLAERKLKASTLGDAIKLIKKMSLCPVNIVTSLEQFYIYRNRTENIGHGAPEFADTSKEDAMLCNEMAVCFINYFHRKGLKPRKALEADAAANPEAESNGETVAGTVAPE